MKVDHELVEEIGAKSNKELFKEVNEVFKPKTPREVALVFELISRAQEGSKAAKKLQKIKEIL